MCLYQDEDGSKNFLVDFEQKSLSAQAERRRLQLDNAGMASSEQQKPDCEDDKLLTEEEEEQPDNPDQQW